jgi:hypothetical protein
MAKKLDGILIEVNGGLVSYVEVDGIPTNAYYLIDWDCLLGDGDTREAWEELEEEVQVFIRDRYSTELAAIQRRLKGEAEDDKTQQT